MRRILCSTMCALALAWPASARAQANRNDVESLKRETEQLKEKVRELEQKIENSAAPTTTEATPWSPAQPVTLLSSGASYLNLSLDLLVDVGTSSERDVDELQLGGHDPSQRGFTLPNLELAFDGAVDPYFKAFANIVYLLDDNGESEVELEEAYGLTTSLPWDLQVKAGQFFAEFGRHNPQHPHVWDFVDQPLILGRLMGPDSLRSVGARVSWLVPTPFYTEWFLAVFNGKGETAVSFRDEETTFGRTPAENDVRNLGDLLYVTRLASSFDLSDTQTLVVGASGAFGPNDSGSDNDTQIYGVDLYWKWRPVSAQKGFPFVSWQTEAMLRRYEAGEDSTVDPVLPEETLKDYGFYSQALWGFRTSWAAGLRGEYVDGDSSDFDDIEPPARADRTRVSPNLTWYPTEFSKLRLQYNYDRGEEVGNEHSVWLQMEVGIGAHPAHKF